MQEVPERKRDLHEVPEATATLGEQACRDDVVRVASTEVVTEALATLIGCGMSSEE